LVHHVLLKHHLTGVQHFALAHTRSLFSRWATISFFFVWWRLSFSNLLGKRLTHPRI
jgi:hypothetical protein